MLASNFLLKRLRTKQSRAIIQSSIRYSGSNSKDPSMTQEPIPEKATEDKAQESAKQRPSTKTQAQLDEDLRRILSGISGDGGEAGVEYEDGRPVTMKKSVKNNMFRYI